MKNPPDIDRMIAVLFSKKQQQAIKNKTACGRSKIEAVRRIMRAGIRAEMVLRSEEYEADRPWLATVIDELRAEIIL